MEVLFKNHNLHSPRVSIVLLDWSVRESAHLLDYLAHQDIPREKIEIIWIEYFSRRHRDIELALRKHRLFQTPYPPVDQWIILGMPTDIYYNKHLMYNVGIVASRGEIVTICDSDAFVRKSFVRSIIESFEEHPDSFLHMDQIRNINSAHYPFNYPTFEEFLDPQYCINMRDGKPKSAVQVSDPIHDRNYGACFSARRRDLIAIGGADEHLDYVGHICGPYDMSFRLMNAGKREIWHSTEWMFHARHPGQDGVGNYLGPHDGFNMSTTALEVVRTGRIFPLVENPAIRCLRLDRDGIFYVSPLESAIPFFEIAQWNVRVLKDEKKKNWKSFQIGRSELFACPQQLMSRVRDFLLSLPQRVSIGSFLTVITLAQVWIKVRNRNSVSVMQKSLIEKIRLGLIYTLNLWKNNVYKTKELKQLIRPLSTGGESVAVYGSGFSLKVVRILLHLERVRLDRVYESADEAGISDYSGKIIVSSFWDTALCVESLQQKGILKENIICLQ